MNPGTSGTLLYMSPQQLEGKTPHVTDDIYALGATLYELLTSKPPFFSGDFSHQIRHAVPVPLNERLKEWGIANKVPTQVEQVILRCLAKDETERPQSARDVAVQLGLISDAAPVVNFHRKISRKNFYFATAGAVVAAAAISYFVFAGLAKKKSAVEMPGPKPVSDPWQENVKNVLPAVKSAPPVEKIIEPTAPPVPAPVQTILPENFTALQLVKLGDHYVSEDSHDQVIEIVSDKSVDDLTPKNWRVIYRIQQAVFRATEVQFADGKMTRIREPNRFFQALSPNARKALDLSKVKLDSDDALKIVMDLPEVRAASVIAVQMRLARGYGGLPVWTVNLFGESDSKLTNEKNLGTIELLADSGKILKNTLAKKSE